MKLKTIALHLAYDLGSAAIGLAADKLRTGLVQRQNAPKAAGNDLQEIRDPFEEGPIKVNARAALEGGKFDKELLDRTTNQLLDYAPKLSVKLSDSGMIEGLGHTVDPDSVWATASPFVKIDGETYMRNEYTPGKLDSERKLFIELTEDDVSAINYGVNSIYHTHRQKGPIATIDREDLTKIFNLLVKLQHKALSNVTE